MQAEQHYYRCCAAFISTPTWSNKGDNGKGMRLFFFWLLKEENEVAIFNLCCDLICTAEKFDSVILECQWGDSKCQLFKAHGTPAFHDHPVANARVLGDHSLRKQPFIRDTTHFWGFIVHCKDKRHVDTYVCVYLGLDMFSCSCISYNTVPATFLAIVCWVQVSTCFVHISAIECPDWKLWK